MYRQINQTTIQRLADGACIPADPDNKDYADYLAWVAAGNAPQAAPVDLNAIWTKIKAHRDALSTNGGYKVEVSPGTFKWFHSDEKSRSQQLALARKADRVQASGGSMAAPFLGNAGLWKTMDGSFVAMTPALAQAILDAAELQEGALFKAAEIHKSTLAASPDPSNYDFTVGWPEVFVG